jgi:hypothetical protein
METDDRPPPAFELVALDRDGQPHTVLLLQGDPAAAEAAGALPEARSA